MKRNADNITELSREMIQYGDGPACPVCGRSRVWRTDSDGYTICGTGEDSGVKMAVNLPCWACRESVDYEEQEVAWDDERAYYGDE